MPYNVNEEMRVQEQLILHEYRLSSQLGSEESHKEREPSGAPDPTPDPRGTTQIHVYTPREK